MVNKNGISSIDKLEGIQQLQQTVKSVGELCSPLLEIQRMSSVIGDSISSQIPPGIANINSGVMKAMEFENSLMRQIPLQYSWQLNYNVSPLKSIVPAIDKASLAGISAYFENMTSSLDRIKSVFDMPIMHWLKDIEWYPFNQVREIIEEPDGQMIDANAYQKIYLNAMYDEKWFPYFNFGDTALHLEILCIIYKTSRKKDRNKKINDLIFKYYNKGKIESIRKEWKNCGIPYYKLRILKHSVDAYYRNEYVLTVNTLASLWEGIIADKINAPNNYRISSKTRQNLMKLIDENKYDKTISSFCKEFIFYDCHSIDEVVDDVPGRHGIAHSWYNKYPSKKAALHAIFFTDFLFNLTPIIKEENKVV